MEWNIQIFIDSYFLCNLLAWIECRVVNDFQNFQCVYNIHYFPILFKVIAVYFICDSHLSKLHVYVLDIDPEALRMGSWLVRRRNQLSWL